MNQITAGHVLVAWEGVTDTERIIAASRKRKALC